MKEIRVPCERTINHHLDQIAHNATKIHNRETMGKFKQKYNCQYCVDIFRKTFSKKRGVLKIIGISMGINYAILHVEFLSFLSDKVRTTTYKRQKYYRSLCTICSHCDSDDLLKSNRRICYRQGNWFHCTWQAYLHIIILRLYCCPWLNNYNNLFKMYISSL